MPELPEVETFRKTLEAGLVSLRIEKINIYYDKLISSNLDEFISKVTNQTFLSIGRIGKFLLFHLSSSFCLLSHLRMEGKFFIEPINEERKKHDLAEFILSNNTKLVYNDTRKFGFIALYKESEVLTNSPLAKLGKEPFSISDNELFNGLNKRSFEIKEGLLDQTLMSGLGNIYADEVLYRSNINPRTPCNHINLEEARKIKANSIYILTKAIENNGSTIKSFHFKEGASGNMQTLLSCYGKEGESCPRCGALFHKIRIGGRGTTYCPSCQKDPTRPYVIGITGPIHSGKSSVSSYFKNKGFAIFDADKDVVYLYKKEGVKEKLSNLFGASIIKDNQIDKKELSSVLLDKKKKETLMDYLYPLVYKDAEKFILEAKSNVVLDVPLLYKSSLDNLTDFVIYLDSPLENRKERIEKEGRDSSTLLKINEGYPASISKKRASICINNDSSLDNLYKKLDEIIIPKGYKY